MLEGKVSIARRHDFVLAGKFDLLNPSMHPRVKCKSFKLLPL
jgi:hypothetical protein